MVTSRIECSARPHRVQHERDAARLGLEQIRERRRLLFMLGRREARAFDEVHHRDRDVHELCASTPGRGDIPPRQLRPLLQLLPRVALHEGKIERPPRQPEQRHPEQLTLQEKTQQRHAPVQRGLQHRDVDPGLVIRHHQVMAVGPQLGVDVENETGAGEPANQRGVDADPAGGDGRAAASRTRGG